MVNEFYLFFVIRSNEISSICKDDSANCLLKSKVVEALIANGNPLVLELYNQLEAIHIAERV